MPLNGLEIFKHGFRILTFRENAIFIRNPLFDNVTVLFLPDLKYSEIWLKRKEKRFLEWTIKDFYGILKLFENRDPVIYDKYHPHILNVGLGNGIGNLIFG